MLRYLPLLFLLVACSNTNTEINNVAEPFPTQPYLIVLGIAQDAGFPQADCKKSCCQKVWQGEQQKKSVSCLGLVDPISNKAYLFDATPDFKDQLFHLQDHHPNHPSLDGIFLTHAHIGHYTGLMHLGREAMGAKEVPVFAMPRMNDFLTNHGPWSQLVALKNISLQELQADATVSLSNEEIKITPFSVPHRDEYSETVGFKIQSKDKSAIFIPDIDKWNLWDQDIKALIKSVDYAFLDGTFYENGEIPNRDMSLIPHPFVEESMALFKELDAPDKAKIHFIHFNHTNPLLQENSEAQSELEAAGFNLAVEEAIYAL